MVLTQLELKSYPSLIRLDAVVRYKQVNATLRVNYTIPQHALDTHMMTVVSGHRRIQHADLEDIGEAIIHRADKFTALIEGKLFAATQIRFRDFYIDNLKKTYVFNFGFQEADFKRSYKLPKCAYIINNTDMPSILEYIQVRTKSKRTKAKMPKVVAKNLGRA